MADGRVTLQQAQTFLDVAAAMDGVGKGFADLAPNGAPLVLPVPASALLGDVRSQAEAMTTEYGAAVQRLTAYADLAVGGFAGLRDVAHAIGTDFPASDARSGQRVRATRPGR